MILRETGRTQEMAAGVLGISDLFQKNCTEILQKIFLYLDPRSLHSSRQVCQQWNIFILSSVWGSRSGFNSLQRRLHYNWLNKEPELLNVAATEGVYGLRALTDNCLVVSDVDGGAKVIDLVSQEILAHLNHPDIVYEAVITETWIITANRGLTYIWNRETFEKMQALYANSFDFVAAETGDRALYVSFSNVDDLTLYKTSPEKSQEEKILVIPEMVQNSLLFKNDDTLSLVTVDMKTQFFRIYEVLKGDVVTRTFGDAERDSIVCSLSVSRSHLISVHWDCVDLRDNGKMKVWDMDTSSKLYSIDINSMPDSVVIQNNLVKIASRDKIFVFDGTTIGDETSVIKSKREISFDLRRKVLFNKSMAVNYDTIMNFWN